MAAQSQEQWRFFRLWSRSRHPQVVHVQPISWSSQNWCSRVYDVNDAQVKKYHSKKYIAIWLSESIYLRLFRPGDMIYISYFHVLFWVTFVSSTICISLKLDELLSCSPHSGELAFRQRLGAKIDRHGAQYFWIYIKDDFKRRPDRIDSISCNWVQ